VVWQHRFHSTLAYPIFGVGFGEEAYVSTGEDENGDRLYVISGRADVHAAVSLLQELGYVIALIDVTASS
jgi:hypothetical protein